MSSSSENKEEQAEVFWQEVEKSFFGKIPQVLLQAIELHLHHAAEFLQGFKAASPVCSLESSAHGMQAKEMLRTEAGEASPSFAAQRAGSILLTKTDARSQIFFGPWEFLAAQLLFHQILLADTDDQFLEEAAVHEEKRCAYASGINYGNLDVYATSLLGYPIMDRVGIMEREQIQKAGQCKHQRNEGMSFGKRDEVQDDVVKAVCEMKVETESSATRRYVAQDASAGKLKSSRYESMVPTRVTDLGYFLRAFGLGNISTYNPSEAIDLLESVFNQAQTQLQSQRANEVAPLVIPGGNPQGVRIVFSFPPSGFRLSHYCSTFVNELKVTREWPRFLQLIFNYHVNGLESSSWCKVPGYSATTVTAKRKIDERGDRDEKREGEEGTLPKRFGLGRSIIGPQLLWRVGSPDCGSKPTAALSRSDTEKPDNGYAACPAFWPCWSQTGTTLTRQLSVAGRMEFKDQPFLVFSDSCKGVSNLPTETGKARDRDPVKEPEILKNSLQKFTSCKQFSDGLAAVEVEHEDEGPRDAVLGHSVGSSTATLSGDTCAALYGGSELERERAYLLHQLRSTVDAKFRLLQRLHGAIQMYRPPPKDYWKTTENNMVELYRSEMFSSTAGGRYSYSLSRQYRDFDFLRMLCCLKGLDLPAWWSEQGLCSVCGSGIAYDDDPIIFCDGCFIPAHHGCVGYPTVTVSVEDIPAFSVAPGLLEDGLARNANGGTVDERVQVGERFGRLTRRAALNAAVGQIRTTTVTSSDVARWSSSSSEADDAELTQKQKIATSGGVKVECSEDIDACPGSLSQEMPNVEVSTRSVSACRKSILEKEVPGWRAQGDPSKGPHMGRYSAKTMDRASSAGFTTQRQQPTRQQHTRQTDKAQPAEADFTNSSDAEWFCDSCHLIIQQVGDVGTAVAVIRHLAGPRTRKEFDDAFLHERAHELPQNFTWYLPLLLDEYYQPQMLFEADEDQLKSENVEKPFVACADGDAACSETLKEDVANTVNSLGQELEDSESPRIEKTRGSGNLTNRSRRRRFAQGVVPVKGVQEGYPVPARKKREKVARHGRPLDTLSSGFSREATGIHGNREDCGVSQRETSDRGGGGEPMRDTIGVGKRSRSYLATQENKKVKGELNMDEREQGAAATNGSRLESVSSIPVQSTVQQGSTSMERERLVVWRSSKRRYFATLHTNSPTYWYCWRVTVDAGEIERCKESFQHTPTTGVHRRRRRSGSLGSQPTRVLGSAGGAAEKLADSGSNLCPPNVKDSRPTGRRWCVSGSMASAYPGGLSESEAKSRLRDFIVYVPCCALCGYDAYFKGGGVIKKGISSRKRREFAHVRCATAANGILAPDAVRYTVDPERAKLRCTYCRQAGPAPVQCQHNHCSRAYHVSCASQARDCVTEFAEVRPIVYCHVHSKEKPPTQALRVYHQSLEKRRRLKRRLDEELLSTWVNPALLSPLWLRSLTSVNNMSSTSLDFLVPPSLVPFLRSAKNTALESKDRVSRDGDKQEASGAVVMDKERTADEVPAGSQKAAEPCLGKGPRNAVSTAGVPVPTCLSDTLSQHGEKGQPYLDILKELDPSCRFSSLGFVDDAVWIASGLYCGRYRVHVPAAGTAEHLKSNILAGPPAFSIDPTETPDAGVAGLSQSVVQRPSQLNEVLRVNMDVPRYNSEKVATASYRVYLNQIRGNGVQGLMDTAVRLYLYLKGEIPKRETLSDIASVALATARGWDHGVIHWITHVTRATPLASKDDMASVQRQNTSATVECRNHETKLETSGFAEILDAWVCCCCGRDGHLYPESRVVKSLDPDHMAESTRRGKLVVLRCDTCGCCVCLPCLRFYSQYTDRGTGCNGMPGEQQSGFLTNTQTAGVQSCAQGGAVHNQTLGRDVAADVCSRSISEASNGVPDVIFQELDTQNALVAGSVPLDSGTVCEGSKAVYKRNSKYVANTEVPLTQGISTRQRADSTSLKGRTSSAPVSRRVPRHQILREATALSGEAWESETSNWGSVLQELQNVPFRCERCRFFFRNSGACRPAYLSSCILCNRNDGYLLPRVYGNATDKRGMLLSQGSSAGKPDVTLNNLDGSTRDTPGPVGTQERELEASSLLLNGIPQKGAECYDQSAGLHWVHPSCAEWFVPSKLRGQGIRCVGRVLKKYGCRFGGSGNDVVAASTLSASKTDSTNMCMICNVASGALWTCSNPRCSNTFHVSCSRLWNCKFDQPTRRVGAADRGLGGVGASRRAYCLEHSLTANSQTLMVTKDAELLLWLTGIGVIASSWSNSFKMHFWNRARQSGKNDAQAASTLDFSTLLIQSFLSGIGCLPLIFPTGTPTVQLKLQWVVGREALGGFVDWSRHTPQPRSVSQEDASDQHAVAVALLGGTERGRNDGTPVHARDKPPSGRDRLATIRLLLVKAVTKAQVSLFMELERAQRAKMTGTARPRLQSTDNLDAIKSESPVNSIAPVSSDDESVVTKTVDDNECGTVTGNALTDIDSEVNFWLRENRRRVLSVLRPSADAPLGLVHRLWATASSAVLDNLEDDPSRRMMHRKHGHPVPNRNRLFGLKSYLPGSPSLDGYPRRRKRASYRSASSRRGSALFPPLPLKHSLVLPAHGDRNMKGGNGLEKMSRVKKSSLVSDEREKVGTIPGTGRRRRGRPRKYPLPEPSASEDGRGSTFPTQTALPLSPRASPAFSAEPVSPEMFAYSPTLQQQQQQREEQERHPENEEEMRTRQQTDAASQLYQQQQLQQHQQQQQHVQQLQLFQQQQIQHQFQLQLQLQQQQQQHHLAPNGMVPPFFVHNGQTVANPGVVMLPYNCDTDAARMPAGLRPRRPLMSLTSTASLIPTFDLNVYGHQHTVGCGGQTLPMSASSVPHTVAAYSAGSNVNPLPLMVPLVRTGQGITGVPGAVLHQSERGHLWYPHTDYNQLMAPRIHQQASSTMAIAAASGSPQSLVDQQQLHPYHPHFRLYHNPQELQTIRQHQYPVQQPLVFSALGMSIPGHQNTCMMPPTAASHSAARLINVSGGLGVSSSQFERDAASVLMPSPSTLPSAASQFAASCQAAAYPSSPQQLLYSPPSQQAVSPPSSQQAVYPSSPQSAVHAPASRSAADPSACEQQALYYNRDSPA